MFFRANYNVWSIKENQFDERWSFEKKIKFLAQYGIMAPSCHNTQPWKFKVVNNCLEIYPDVSKKLLIADPVGRGLYISLGCCLENIIIASRHFGLSSLVDFEVSTNINCPAIKIIFKENHPSNADYSDLFPFISEHKMNKFDYFSNR
ncbi:MAG: hypothetical protein HY979_02300, partial [Candidatus Magasanikbacteria bacterium]|nr:hypothetical protein [Candidatus Magasanikbacteria bacterium]